MTVTMMKGLYIVHIIATEESILIKTAQNNSASYNFKIPVLNKQPITLDQTRNRTQDLMFKRSAYDYKINKVV